MINQELKEKLSGLIYDAVDKEWFLTSKSRIPQNPSVETIDWEMVEEHLNGELISSLSESKGFMAFKPKYKIGDTVYLATPPHWVSFPEDGNILKAEIKGVKVEEKAGSVSIEYFVFIGLQESTAKEPDLFDSFESAVEKANELVLERKEKLLGDLAELNACLAANQRIKK